MRTFVSGVALQDDFTGEILDFYEFGSRVMLKTHWEDKAREVILVGSEHTQIGGALLAAIPTENILYIDLSEPEFDEDKRYIPLKERTRSILANEIESIEDLKSHSIERKESEDITY